MNTMFQKYIYAKPGQDVFYEDVLKDKHVFQRRELTPPVKVKIKYWLKDEGEVWKDVIIKTLHPKCLQDVFGWQKPFWCVNEWKEM